MATECDFSETNVESEQLYNTLQNILESGNLPHALYTTFLSKLMNKIL